MSKEHAQLLDDFKEIFHHSWVQSMDENASSDPGVDMEQFKVEISNEYDRKIISDYEPKIPLIWANHCKGNPTLFNGSKFRLHGLSFEKGHKTVLKLGLSCYRDFMCTNMSEECPMLMNYGMSNYKNQQACMSDKFGVAALVISSDDQVLFMQRSMLVGEEAGMVGFPGGHPEPKEVGLDDTSCGKTTLVDVLSEKVIHEIFYSNIKEVRDEVNIPEMHLTWPLLTGIFREKGSGIPNSCFLIRCNLTGEEIINLYRQGGPEAYESTDLILVDLQDIRNYSSSAKMQKLLQKATPSTKACIYFFIT